MKQFLLYILKDLWLMDMAVEERLMDTATKLPLTSFKNHLYFFNVQSTNQSIFFIFQSDEIITIKQKGTLNLDTIREFWTPKTDWLGLGIFISKDEWELFLIIFLIYIYIYIYIYIIAYIFLFFGVKITLRIANA